MAKKTSKRPKPRAASGLQPEPLSMGEEVLNQGEVWRVIAIDTASSLEQRYRVTDAPGREGVLWLRHRTRRESTLSGFGPEVECLKRLHKKRRVRLLPEVLAHFEDDRGEFLVMRRLFAPTLDLSWDDICKTNELTLCFEQLMLAVSKVHRTGYVITDLAPQSFARNDDGDIQLVELSHVTRRGFHPRYIERSPYTDPDLKPDDSVDERHDIYSMAALLASAHRRRIFMGSDDPAELVAKEAVKQPVISQLLMGGLSDRDFRFLSVDEMRILLYQLKNEQARFARPTAAMCSTVGVSRHRYINEDSAGFQDLGVQYQSRPQYVGFFCVADGMGGHELGERASQLAVLGALQAFRQLTQEVPFERLYEGLPTYALTIGRAASEIVCTGAQQFPGGARMGTTFSGILVINDELAVTHVGDSRASLVRGGQLVPITLDHSLVASLVRLGQMTPEQAAVSEERNVLVRCIDARVPMDESGFDSLAQVGYEDRRLKMKPGDRVVLTSDGVWGAVDDVRLLEAIVKGGGPQEIADRIVALAITSGSDDNATALVVSWH